MFSYVAVMLCVMSCDVFRASLDCVFVVIDVYACGVLVECCVCADVACDVWFVLVFVVRVCVGLRCCCFRSIP